VQGIVQKNRSVQAGTFFSPSLLQSLSRNLVEEFVHCFGRFFCAAIEPPPEKRQQVSGERMGPASLNGKPVGKTISQK
jgi:hypothetical protein